MPEAIPAFAVQKNGVAGFDQLSLVKVRAIDLLDNMRPE
jgi:hypothetical protein